MPLSNISSRERTKNLLIVLLAAAALVVVLPIIITGTSGVFYNIDPGAVYIGNALSYVKSNTIHYRDHPGTPAIFLIASSFWPLRIFAKLVVHVPFISWAFTNIRTVFLYSRLFQSFLFMFSITLFLLAIHRATKSILPVIFAWLALFTFTFFPRLGIKVSAETTSFLIISIWLLIFTRFMKNKSPLTVLILSLISGIAVANKFNNIVLVFASLLMIFSIESLKMKQKIYNMFVNGLMASVGFIIGTWPIRRSYPVMFARLFKVAMQSGPKAAHGVGENSFIDLGLYFESVARFFQAERWAVYIFLFVLALVIYEVVIRKIRIKSPVVVLLFAVLVNILLILKYPLNYYQLPNYFIIVFIGSILLQRRLMPLQVIFCLALIPLVFLNIQRHFFLSTKDINNSVILEEYIKEHPAKYATLWDFGRAQDFVYIWIRGWARGIFSEELSMQRPDLLELKSDYKTVYLDDKYINSKNIFDACWDKLYIREPRAKVLLDKYPDQKLEYTPISNTRIWEIESKHCFVNF